MQKLFLRVSGLSCVLLMLLIRCAAADMDMEEKHFIYPQYSKRISMDFRGANLNDVLKIFSKQTGLNFISSQEVGEKKVTLFFEKIPVEAALEKILAANDLTYEMQPDTDIFIVKPISTKDPLATRVYQLKYASVPSSKLKSTIAIAAAGSSSSDSSAAASSTTSASSEGLFAAVKSVMTRAGVITQDARTNSLIITDVESQFPLIESTIAKLDVQVVQIMIQVEMLDVSKNSSDLVGVKWGDTPLVVSGATKQSFFPFDGSAYGNKLGTSSFGSSSSSSSSTSSATTNGPYSMGKVDFSGMKAVLNFLKTRTDTKTLARPKLMTLNNETAEIKISTNQAIGILQSTNTSSTTGTQTNQAERVQTGVFLTVTPQANVNTREIVMAVNPKVIDARAGATFGNQTFRDPEERGSQSILRVKDGDTIIIGGLLRKEENNSITKVPILGDLPVIGMAFRHKDKATTNRELIIFMTPNILDNKKAEDMVHDRTNQVENMKDPTARSGEIDTTLSTIEQQRF